MKVTGRGLGWIASAVALGACGLAVGLSGGAARAGEPAPGLVGDWEGQVVFADGQEARTTLCLEAAGQGWRGAWELTPLDEERAGTPQTGQVTFQRGSGEAGTDDLQAELPGPGPGHTRFRGRVTGAGSHAEAALIGTFQGARPGVAILWRYRR